MRPPSSLRTCPANDLPPQDYDRGVQPAQPLLVRGLDFMIPAGFARAAMHDVTLRGTIVSERQKLFECGFQLRTA